MRASPAESYSFRVRANLAAETKPSVFILFDGTLFDTPNYG